MKKKLLFLILVLSLFCCNTALIYAESTVKTSSEDFATRGEVAEFIALNYELKATTSVEMPKDIEEYKYADSVVEVLEAEIMGLYDDGTFRPEDYINRGTFALILVRLKEKMNYDFSVINISSSTINDIENHWSEPYMSVLINLDIFVPDNMGKVYPDNKLTKDYLNNKILDTINNYKLNVTEDEFTNVDYNRSNDIRVLINGIQVQFDVSPQLINGRTLVPMRLIFEALGLNVEWDNFNKIAKGVNLENSISFAIGSNKALVNNQEKILDVPAMIINNRTMIPLRFLSENLGYNVVWVGDSNLILISKSYIVEWRYGGYEFIEPYKEYEIKYINGVKTIETRYNGKKHNVKIEWKSGGYESVSPYKEYEIKYVDGVKTSETRYTGKIKPIEIEYKKIDYSWEYPYGWYTWEYSLNIPVGAVNIYKSIERKYILGYSYYVTHEEDDEYMNALAKIFINTVREEGYSEWDLINLAVSFVQSLKYVPDKIGTGYDEYPKFPLETLYDQGGDCEDSSILLASLLRELGYGTVLVVTDDHMGVGLKTSDSGNFTFMKMNFYYIETTSPGWEIGELPASLEGERITILPVN